MPSIAEVVALLVGITCVVVTLPMKDRKITYFLVAFAVAAQATQFAYAIESRQAANDLLKASNRAYASILYAVAERDAELSRIIEKLKTGRQYRTEFVLGYMAYRENRNQDAAVHFANSLKSGEFVAQSEYLLGYMDYREAKTKQDFDHVRDHLKRSSSADNSYGAAHYLSAILDVRDNDIDEALEQLSIAAHSDEPAICVDLTKEKEVREVWPAIATDRRFLKLQKECRETAS